ncbi:MAG: ABC transporter substrate-binding protein [Lachnospiraceae bacterium]|nr:ABC transporter substrate-binding protein [Lachnospiraceae bacterium]
MKKMKRILALLLVSVMMTTLFAACGSSADDESDTTTAAADATTLASENSGNDSDETTAGTSDSATTADDGSDSDEDHYPVTITTYNYAKEEIEVTFTECPTKVICTNQTQTEIMLYFGLDDYIAGVSYLDGDIREDLQAQYDQLVADGKELTVVGYPDKETVLALEPDFIFGWRSAFADTALGDVSEWQELGVNTMILRCSNNTASDLTITSVLADIADIGAIFNIEDQTDAYIAEAEEMLADISDTVNALGEDEVLNVLMIEFTSDGQWYAWPTTSLTGSLVESAGAVNLVSESADLSVEDIIAYNPDAIIIDYYEDQYGEDYDQDEATAAAIATLTGEEALAEVTAVAEGKIMGVNLTDVYGGGIRIVSAVQAMYEFLYGEDF